MIGAINPVKTFYIPKLVKIYNYNAIKIKIYVCMCIKIAYVMCKVLTSAGLLRRTLRQN